MWINNFGIMTAGVAWGVDSGEDGVTSAVYGRAMPVEPGRDRVDWRIGISWAQFHFRLYSENDFNRESENSAIEYGGC